MADGKGFTVMVFDTEQPVVLAKVRVNVPGKTGFTIVDVVGAAGSTPPVKVAIPAALLDQLPSMASVSVIVCPIHTALGPLIPVDNEFTVTITELKQPVKSLVYLMVDVVGVTVATAVTVVHKPPVIRVAAAVLLELQV